MFISGRCVSVFWFYSPSCGVAACQDWAAMRVVYTRQLPLSAEGGGMVVGAGSN